MSTLRILTHVTFPTMQLFLRYIKRWYFLNDINISGLPVKKIFEKGMTDYADSSFHPSNGHCNGTRYRVTEFKTRVIEATTASVISTLENVCFVPHIHLMIPDIQSRFYSRRREFPIKLAKPFTTNKSQGQRLEHVAELLLSPMSTQGSYMSRLVGQQFI